MKSSQQIWNGRYSNNPIREVVRHDKWLEKWKDSIQEMSGYALDLGCGRGADSNFLLENGYTVTAVDFAKEAIEQCKEVMLGVDFRVMDFSDGLAFPSSYFSVVVASLSLHYFEKKDTIRIIQDISRVLKNGGLFIFRVNAIGDSNFGYEEKLNVWDTILVDGVLKQHYSKEMIEELLRDQFAIKDLEFSETNRYGKTKRVFQCMACKL